MIHLSKDGIRFTNDFNPECDKYVDRMVDSAIPYMRHEVALSDDYTLYDLFKMLQKEMDKYNLIFCSYLGNHDLGNYWIDMCSEFEKASDVDYLEVYWYCGCNAYEQRGYKEWKNDISVNPEFHGWGTWDENEHAGIPKGYKGGMAIEFTPLAELKNLPLRIRTKTKITLDDGTYDEDGNNKVLFEGDKCFSVFDFVSAILFEISFMGSPIDRDEALESLVEDRKDAEEKLATGELKSFATLEELKEDLKK